MSRYAVTLPYVNPFTFLLLILFDFFAGYPVSPDSVEATKTCH